MASVLEKYLQQIRDATSKPGIYAYRGQSRAEWPLHSAATRRLIKSLGDGALNAPWFTKVYIDYHRETLVDAGRTRGFGVEAGRDIPDLQLLAKLQHFGAATGLLDFTWSPLIALWFASRESDSDGKLFVVNANDPIHVAKLPSDPKRQTIDDVFSRVDNAPGLLYWEPMWSGDAVPRILRQRGVFIIGRPLVPTGGQIIREIEVSKGDTASLIEELRWLDISESSLFPDVYGFSSLEGATASTHVSTPQFYLIQGNQHFQAGYYEEAIDAYDRSIGLSPGVGELYFLRGNAKSSAKSYREAVDDYRQAIAHRERPVLGLERTVNNGIFASLVFMAYYNCGNALAEISDYGVKWTPLSRPILGEFKVDCVFVFDRHFLSEVEVSGYLIVESLVRSVLVIEEEVVDQSLDQKGDGVAREMGLVRFGTLSLDGTKVRAKASKRKAMSYERMLKEQARLEKEIGALLSGAVSIDAEEDARYGADVRGDELPVELQRRQARLAAIRAARERLEASQRAVDDARGRKPGQKRNPKGGRPYKRAYGEPAPKAQSNFTDPESRIMKTSAEGFQQCYNAQTVVDAERQIIVAAHLGSQATDQGFMLPLLDGVQETFGVKPGAVLADAGYCNEEDLATLEERGIDGYVALGREGKERVDVDSETLPATHRMGEKLTSPEGRGLYAKRKWLSEAPNGWIKEVLGFRRFSFRGLEKVRAEWDLVCLALNVKRMAALTMC